MTLVDVGLLLDARFMRATHTVQILRPFVPQPRAARELAFFDPGVLRLHIAEELGEFRCVTAFFLEQVHEICCKIENN